MSHLLNAALAYAAAGWHVTPVGAGPDRKRPLTEHGLKDATTDPEIIRAWWTQWPDANVAAATEPSGLAVVDIDDPTVELPDQLTPTLTVRTPRGGSHHIYSGDIKNSQSKLAPKVDTRGRGGYILLPPSVTPAGTYAWVNQDPIGPVPAWIPETLERKRERDTPTEVPDGSADRWGRRVLDGELARIATAVEGTRNAEMFEAACNVFEAVKGGHLSYDEAYGKLALAAERAGLEPREIEASLESAWERTEERHPAEIPTAQVVEPPPTGAPLRDNEPGFELLSPADLANQPPPKWLIPERVPEGFTIIAGRKASGKTLTVLDWSATVAATADRPVIYFVGEGYAGFVQRVLTWAAHHQLDLTGRLWVVRGVPRILDEESRRKFYVTVRRANAGLVVVDTYAKTIPGVNENESAPATMVADAFNQIHEAYDTSSVLVMHTGATDERTRGHTSLEDAADAIWLAKRSKTAPDQYQLFNDKMKDDEEQPPQLYRIAPSEASIVAFPSEYPRVSQHANTYQRPA